MTEYEVFVETINPCGGAQHAKRELLEVEAESPEAYVRAHSPWPILDTIESADGSTRIVTGDGHGNMIKYTFTD